MAPELGILAGAFFFGRASGIVAGSTTQPPAPKSAHITSFVADLTPGAADQAAEGLPATWNRVMFSPFSYLAARPQNQMVKPIKFLRTATDPQPPLLGVRSARPLPPIRWDLINRGRQVHRAIAAAVPSRRPIIFVNTPINYNRKRRPPRTMPDASANRRWSAVAGRARMKPTAPPINVPGRSTRPRTAKTLFGKSHLA